MNEDWIILINFQSVCCKVLKCLMHRKLIHSVLLVSYILYCACACAKMMDRINTNI